MFGRDGADPAPLFSHYIFSVYHKNAPAASPAGAFSDKFKVFSFFGGKETAARIPDGGFLDGED
jgi:hypothetical protein